MCDVNGLTYDTYAQFFLSKVCIPVLPDAVYQLPQRVPCEYRDTLCSEPHQDMSEIL